MLNGNSVNTQRRYVGPHNGNLTESELRTALEYERLSAASLKTARSIMEELGSGCDTSTNDDSTVSGGGEPYETIDEVREMLLQGEALSRTPWGGNAKDNRTYYIVDTGHEVTVKPREEPSVPSSSGPSDGPDMSSVKESVRRVERFLEEWMEENDWQTRQAEVSDRLDQHGEVFDILNFEESGLLKVYFAEPWDLDDDPSSQYQDSEDSTLQFSDFLGVRRYNDVTSRVHSYYLDGQWYMSATEQRENTLGSTLLQHRRRNVLSSVRRGRTLYWPVREELTWAKKLLSNLMRVSGFQAAFGAIRTISAMHGTDAVRNYLASQQSGTAGNSGNYEKFDMPSPLVVTVPDSIKYEFPETGAGNSNQIEVLVQLLRACASGMKLPEFMLTANVSEGNFASTLVSEGPFHKAMRWEQSLMVKEDRRILMRALMYAAKSGQHDLTVEDVQAVRLHVKPPRVQTRNRKEDFDVNQKLWEDGLLSGKDHLAAEGQEYESQQAQIRLERDDEQPLPAGSPAAKPGPTPASSADPMMEPGVMKEDPGRKTAADNLGN